MKFFGDHKSRGLLCVDRVFAWRVWRQKIETKVSKQGLRIVVCRCVWGALQTECPILNHVGEEGRPIRRLYIGNCAKVFEIPKVYKFKEHSTINEFLHSTIKSFLLILRSGKIIILANAFMKYRRLYSKPASWIYFNTDVFLSDKFSYESFFGMRVRVKIKIEPLFLEGFSHNVYWNCLIHSMNSRQLSCVILRLSNQP